MQIDKLGYYKTRDGSTVLIWGIAPAEIHLTYPIKGAMLDDGKIDCSEEWLRNGKYDKADDDDQPNDDDIVSYIGAELPKEVTRDLYAHIIDLKAGDISCFDQYANQKLAHLIKYPDYYLELSSYSDSRIAPSHRKLTVPAKVTFELPADFKC
jgi:hypothetical protein